MKRALHLWVLLPLAIVCNAQADVRNPGPEALLKTARGDTARARIWYDWAWAQEDRVAKETGIQRMMETADRAAASTNAAERRIGQLYQGRAHTMRSRYMYSDDDPLPAIKEAQRGLQVFNSLNDTAGILEALELFRGVSMNHGNAADYVKATDRMLTIYAALGDSLNLSYELGNISLAYQDIDPARALEPSLRSLAIAERVDKGHGVAVANRDLGHVYRLLGRLDSAGYYNQRAIDWFETNASPGEPLGLERTYFRRADILDAKGDKEGALRDYLRAAQVSNSWWRAVCEGSAARVLLDLGREKEALALARTAKADADSSGALKRLELTARVLKDALRVNGKYDEALQVMGQWMAVRDSLHAMDGREELIGLELQREALADSLRQVTERDDIARKDRIEMDRERSRKWVLGSTGLFFLLVAIGIIFQLRSTLRSHKLIAAEKGISEGLLLNILPAEVAEELKAKGEADARLVDSVTVLFTDFKGFAEMSERLGPKELVRDIHECFSAFDRIMEKHGIEKIKTIGDAYMAVGGLPTPNATHALDVISAALEIRDFIAEGKRLKIAKGLPYFEIRIGIHTGPVVAGIVGVKKFSYDIWGDTVNTASRMESSGEAGQVNISESTYALVKDEPGLAFTSRGKVQAKGKGEMEMYFVGAG